LSGQPLCYWHITTEDEAVKDRRDAALRAAKHEKSKKQLVTVQYQGSPPLKKKQSAQLQVCVDCPS
jgi:hypothetical protein